MLLIGGIIQILSSESEKLAAPVAGFAELEAQYLTPKPIRRGDVVVGKVVSVDGQGVWVNIGSKFEGVISASELKSADGQIKIGDDITVYVVATGKKGEGGLLLSYDRAKKFVGWQDLELRQQNGDTLTAQVESANKGGLLARCQGVEGFIPMSEVVGRRLPEKVGQTIQVKILELNPRQQRLILSERLAYMEEREREKERALAQLQPGETRAGRVTGIQDFGVFVDIGGVEGLCPLSELCWERGKLPQEIVKKGQEVKVVVIRVEAEAKKVLLSLKRATPHPWETALERYKVGQQVFGTITKLFPFGALARVDGAIEGLIHISELSWRRIAHPKEVVREGQVLPLKVLSIDPLKKHLRLSLKQAQGEGDPAQEQSEDGQRI